KRMESGNYDPEIQKKVRQSIDELYYGIYNPRIYFEEWTYYSEKNRRCVYRERYNAEKPLTTSHIYKDGKYYDIIFEPEEAQQVGIIKSTRSWFMPQAKLCRFGA